MKADDSERGCMRSVRINIQNVCIEVKTFTSKRGIEYGKND